MTSHTSSISIISSSSCSCRSSVMVLIQLVVVKSIDSKQQKQKTRNLNESGVEDEVNIVATFAPVSLQGVSLLCFVQCNTARLQMITCVRLYTLHTYNSENSTTQHKQLSTG